MIVRWVDNMFNFIQRLLFDLLLKYKLWRISLLRKEKILTCEICHHDFLGNRYSVLIYEGFPYITCDNCRVYKRRDGRIDV